MASASSPPCDAQLLCSICLDVFTEPVSTPCGHNYCRTCITGFWAASCQVHCPLCMRRFRRVPRLQINTAFRDMVEHFKGARGEGGVPADPGDVPCDICLDPKLKAQKTCLVCLASYCRLHLEPHQRVKTLKKHRLTDPVSDLRDRLCEKHDKLLELFCCEDQTCVCFMCTNDDHAAHRAVPLERAFRERKVQLDRETTGMKMKEDAMSRSIKAGKHSAAQSKKESEKEMADIAKAFNSLVASRARSQAELTEVIREKRNAAQKQVEDHVTRLEQEVAELRRRRSEMEQLSQTEDHLRLIQRWPSLHIPARAGGPLDPPSPSSPPSASDPRDQQSCVAMVKKAVARLEKTLSNEMEMLIREARCSGASEEERERPAGLVPARWTPPRDKLMILQQYCAVDVTLDAYTANYRLEVSEDGKQLKFRKGLPSLTALFGRRFRNQFLILGKEGFTSGRFYYEVQVSNCMNWSLGVMDESVCRESNLISAPKFGVWVVNSVFDLTQSCCPDITIRFSPQKIGVFVDFEQGELIFYDVTSRTELCSCSECDFTKTEPAFKSFFHYLAGLSYKPKLYPFFGFFRDDTDTTLAITPVVPPT